LHRQKAKRIMGEVLEFKRKSTIPKLTVVEEIAKAENEVDSNEMEAPFARRFCLMFSFDADKLALLELDWDEAHFVLAEAFVEKGFVPWGTVYSWDGNQGTAMMAVQNSLEELAWPSKVLAMLRLIQVEDDRNLLN
jgi:virulence-associated protein VapD